MTTLHRHNALLSQKLQAYIDQRNPQGLLNALNSLTATEFRTAGYLLSAELLPQLSDETFWTFFLAIVPADSKAYLGTFLKAAVSLYNSQKLSLKERPLKSFAKIATAIDGHKTLDALLPVLRKPEEVERLLRVFSSYDAGTGAPYLHRAGTSQAYYVLFKLLKTADSQPSLLRRNAIALMKKGDKLSFNLASILCQYFDLRDIPGSFSLRLHPYELGRLDQGFEVFEKTLNR